MKKKIYTISTAHLDTSWLWSQKETVEVYLPRTTKYNFEYFNQYPDYKFNFEGSYRYELIEEYHPEDFEEIKSYVKTGNWNVTGSCYENGDTNIPSPEALIRNVLYGNSYFYEKFGKKSNDIFLPDCFGFGRALPQVMTHCGLIGFSTQKLSWGSSIEPPFEFGKWKALDNSFVYASMKPGNYSTVLKELRCDYTLGKIKDNEKSIGIPWTMLYYGTGDRGGGPHPTAIETVFREASDNKKCDSEVISGSMVEFFEELKKADNGKLKEFNEEFLMTTHGAGSYTSRTLSKRLNKKCENLLDISEKSNTLSSVLGLKEYPQSQFDFDWKKVLEHHFHDDITGTSFSSCYLKNWNDYYLVLNSAKAEYLSSIKAIADNINTSKFINPVLVYNPNQDDSNETVKMDIFLPYDNVKVLDEDGEEYPSVYKNRTLEFIPHIKGNTIKVFDVIENEKKNKKHLSLDSNILENDRYVVTINRDCDISSIFDKLNKKELLASPIKYNLMRDVDSIQWPAWEIKYSDINRSPYASFGSGKVSVVDDNDLKTSIKIERKYNKSSLIEIITLDKCSDRVDVYNELDWHEDATNLKISFPFTVKSKNGTYDIGIAKYERPNNTEKLYEVPCQKFARIEDKKYGISVLTDSRQGFDKPTDNEIRLTAVHTPWCNYRYECSQHLLDMGKNIFSYSITSSKVDEDTSIVEAERFTKPINAFKVSRHSGSLGKEITLFNLSNNDARVMCFKKAINDNKYILRVVDYNGEALKGVTATFIKKIKSLSLVRGDEEVLSKLRFTGNKFTFDLNKHEIKSFMIEFVQDDFVDNSKFAELPFDSIGITDNLNRDHSTFKNNVSIPSELIKSDVISSQGIKFNIRKRGLNAVRFNDQEINLDRNYKYAYLLVMNQGKDSEVLINNKKVFIQNSFEDLGRGDLFALRKYGYAKKIPQAFTFTHYHKNGKDQILENLYLYSVKVEIDSDTLVLNKNGNLALFAVTYSNFDNEIECNDKLIDYQNKRRFHYHLTLKEKYFASMPISERFKGIFVNRSKTKYVDWWGGHCAQSPSDFYQIETEKKNFKRREKLNINKLK